MTDWYIAPGGSDTTGNGSVGSPWATLSKFLAKPPVPDDVLYCRGGTYTGPGNRSQYISGISGTSGHPITIKGAPGETAIFDGQANGVSDEDRWFIIANSVACSYWTIQDLTLVNMCVDDGGTIQVSATSGTATTWNLTNLNITKVAPSSNLDHVIYIGNAATNVTVTGCVLKGTYTGAVVGGAGVWLGQGTPPKTVVVTRTVFDHLHKGVQVYGQNGSPNGATLSVTRSTFVGCGRNVELVQYMTATVQNLAGETAGEGAAYNIFDSGTGTLTADHNYWAQVIGPAPTYSIVGRSFVAAAFTDGFVIDGDTAVGGASDSTDAGWQPGNAQNPQPTAAALVITGAVPVVTAAGAQNPIPTPATLVLAGATPTVTTTGAKAPRPTPAALVLTGVAPLVTVSGVNLQLLIGGANKIGSLKAGTLHCTTGPAGSQGIADFTLIDFTPADNATVVVKQGVTTWYSGFVRSIHTVERGKAGHWFCQVGCQNDEPLLIALGAAPFGFSDTPNGTTTKGYEELDYQLTSARGTSYVSTTTAVTIKTRSVGIIPGHTVNVTSADNGLAALPLFCQKVDVSWPTNTPLFTITLGDPVLSFTDTIVNNIANPSDEVAAGLAAALHTPSVFDVLPTLPDPLYPWGSLGLLVTDGKLYRVTPDGTLWTNVLDGTDILVASITAGAIAAGAIGAEALAAQLILASKIVTPALTGARLELDQAGLRSFDSGNAQQVNVPTDGSPVQVTGEVSASKLTATGAAEFDGTNLFSKTSATTLASGVLPPNASPQVSSGWDAHALAFPPHTLGDIILLGNGYWDPLGGTSGATPCYVAAVRFRGVFPPITDVWKVIEWRASDWTVDRMTTLTGLTTTPSFNIRAMTRVGASWFIVADDDVGARVTKITRSTGAQATTATRTFRQYYGITTNGTVLYLPFYDTAFNTTEVESWTTTPAFSSTHSVEQITGGLPRGIAFDGTDWWISWYRSSGIRAYAHNVLTGNIVPNRDFPLGGTVSTHAAAMWDGTGFRGNGGDATGDQSRSFTVIDHTTWDWTTVSSKYWVGYSWYDSSGPADYATTVLADGATGYWRLGDASGPTVTATVGSNLTASGSPTFGATGLLTSTADTAMTFVGASSQSASGSDTGLPTGNNPWTVECWVKTTTANEDGLVLWGTAGASRDACIGLLSGAIIFDTTSLFNSFGGTVNDNAPHHIALTWNGTTMLAYKDGAQVGTGWTPGALNITLAGAAGVKLGTRASLFYDGTLDEVAIYPSVLTPTQLQAHYTSGTATGTRHETPISPRASITMGRRQRLQVTTQAVPTGGAEDPDSARVYMAPGASAPSVGQYKLQSTDAATTRYLTGYNAAGSADGTGSAFPNVTGATMASTDVNGWSLRGDGAVTMPTNRYTESTSFTISGGGTATYGSKVARWSRLGNLVVWRLSFSVTAVGSGGSTVTIANPGWPVPAVEADIAGNRGTVGPQFVTIRLAVSSGDVASMRTIQDNATITGADLANTATYSFNGAYYAD